MRTVTQNNEPEHVPAEVEHIIEEDEKDDALWSVFPKEHVEPLRGLLFLGRLEQEFEFAGHTFLIRTLTEGEHMRIGQLTKQYRGTSSEVDAKITYTVAACVEQVDGELIAMPFDESYDLIYEKVKVVKRWYPTVIAVIFEYYSMLEKTAKEVMESLKK